MLGPLIGFVGPRYFCRAVTSFTHKDYLGRFFRTVVR